MLPIARLRSIWMTALLPIIDIFSLTVGSIVVFLIRYVWFESRFGDRTISFSDYLPVSIFLIAAVIIIYSLLGVYELHKKDTFWITFSKLFLGIAIVLLSVITFFFFNEYNPATLPEGVPVSRFILATGGFFGFYFLLLGRGVFWAVRVMLLNFGIGLSNVVVIGSQAEIRELTTYLQEKGDVSKVLTYSSLNEERLEILKNTIIEDRIAEIYVFGKGKQEEVKLAAMAERYKVNFVFFPHDLGDYSFFSVRPMEIKKRIFLQLNYSSLDGWKFVFKRLFDVLFAMVFLLLFSWVYIFVALAIRFESKGPIFYLSERVGPNGEVFKLWKFRRMKTEFCTTEDNKEALEVEKKLIASQNAKKDDGPLYKISNDPRSTKVGAFIEKYSIDELPQFINVLLGNMSVVGPRPHQPREVAKYDRPSYFKVFNMKPGITGLAQINGRSDLTFDQEVRWDIYYLEHWTFLLDLWVIVKTPFVLLFNRHKS